MFYYDFVMNGDLTCPQPIEVSTGTQYIKYQWSIAVLSTYIDYIT